MILDFTNRMSVACIEAFITQRLISHPEMVLGFTSGSFDLFHLFHKRYLQKCRRHCDILIVGVDSDAEIRRVKGPTRPVMNEHHRLEMVDGQGYIDICYVLDDLNQFEHVIHLLGSPEKSQNKIFRNQDFLGKEGDVRGSNIAEVVIIEDIKETTSTTELIEKILREHLVGQSKVES
jgi:D-beta-D-heptose 7-phosphate kinase / D-beta-D-heptose 1-phosphate adenosyltransferase